MRGSRTERPGVALALLVAAGPALGQDPPAPGAPGDAEEVAPELPVTLTAQLGLGGQLPEEGFARFSVELTSPDDRPEVSVRVKPEEGDEVLVTFGPTALQASTPRRLSGLVPAHRFAHVDALVIEAVDPDGVVIGRVPLTPDAAHGQLLLVLDRRGRLRPTSPSSAGDRATASRAGPP